MVASAVAGTQASVVAAPGLYSTGAIVVAHGLSCSMACEFSQIRDRTCVSCISRILNQ